MDIISSQRPNVVEAVSIELERLAPKYEEMFGILHSIREKLEQTDCMRVENEEKMTKKINQLIAASREVVEQ